MGGGGKFLWREAPWFPKNGKLGGFVPQVFEKRAQIFNEKSILFLSGWRPVPKAKKGPFGAENDTFVVENELSRSERGTLRAKRASS